MKAPQIIWIVLVSFELLTSLTLHGDRKSNGHHNFWATLVSTAFSTGLMFWGGFF